MELEKIRSVFPDFQMEHFHMFDTITSLKWENIFVCESGEGHKTLLLRNCRKITDATCLGESPEIQRKQL